MLSRRRFLAGTAGLSALAGAPRLVRSAASADGFTVLRAEGGVAPLLGETGDPTAIWGYNGQCPGPTLRVRQGETLKVRLVNELLEPTSIHWHGLRLPNAMDGTALTQEPVRPGDSFDYVFDPPDAGTFWYHAHIRPAEQVARGLHGALIVEEDSATAPMSEVLMVIDDWWLLESGAINEESFGDLLVAAHGGRMGNWMTVNGTSRPHLPAPAGERLRVRLVNAANARVMRLLFKGADPHLLAIDGQPLAATRSLGSEALVLPPGGRADIGLPRGAGQVIVAVDIGGEPLELAYIDREDPPEPEPEPEPQPQAAAGAGAQPAGVTPKVVSIPRPKPVPKPVIEPDIGDFAPLPANPLPAALDLDGAVAASLVMEGGAEGGMKGAVLDGERMTVRELVGHGMTWAMNGTAGLGEHPLARIERGRTLALTIDNNTAWTHAMHLHGHAVRLIEDGVAGPDWHDTVLVDPQARVTIAFLADNPGRWMVLCQVLEHGEAGLMTWLEVV